MPSKARVSAGVEERAQFVRLHGTVGHRAGWRGAGGRGRRGLRRAVDQLIAQGAEIAAAGIAGVVPAAGRAGPGMKIAGRGKILADQVRSDRLRVVGGERAVFLDQRTVGLDGEDGLADGPDRQRIQPAADDAQHQGDADRRPDVAEDRTAAVIGRVDRWRLDGSSSRYRSHVGLRVFEIGALSWSYWFTYVSYEFLSIRARSHRAFYARFK